MNRAEKRRQNKLAKKAAKNSTFAKSATSSPQQALAIEQSIAHALQCHNAGDLPKAKAIYQQVLQVDPNQPDALHLLGVMAHQVGEKDIAVDLITKATTINPHYAEAHSNLGNVLKDLGRLDDAIASYRKAITIQPEYIEAHYNLGNALKDLGKLEDAVASYRQALKFKPDLAEAHNNLGISLMGLGMPEEAIASYHKALAIKPDDAQTRLNLMEVLEKTNQTEALREAVADGKQNCPGDPSLVLGEARLLKRDGDYASARTILEAVDNTGASAAILLSKAHLLGELCDRLGDADAAYNHFVEVNRLSGETPEGKPVDGGKYLAQIDSLVKCYTPGWVSGWRDVKSSDERPAPTFLVGFPRSGTTLLDTILNSHGLITVTEEKPAVDIVQKAVERLAQGYPNSLADLVPAQLEALRQTYFDELDKHLEPQERSTVVIDKLPLNIVHVGLIHRIFPEARFLFVQRHPCDCVLSCFMQKFSLNEAMANFLDLQNAACLYDKVMTLWQQYQSLLPLKLHTVRYETLIEDFEGTVAPVLDFLGVGWDDGVRNYIETAKNKKINTPSYNQVTQPLYTHARGRWQRYREQLKPVLPVLLAWAKRFGYED